MSYASGPLEAIDGTPVVDIKPVLSSGRSRRSAFSGVLAVPITSGRAMTTPP